jgi:hypothetical protein
MSVRVRKVFDYKRVMKADGSYINPYLMTYICLKVCIIFLVLQMHPIMC